MANGDTIRKIDSGTLEPTTFDVVELAPGVPTVLEAGFSLAGPRANRDQLGIGFDAELRAVVQLAPGSDEEGDSNELFIFDRGINPKVGVLVNNKDGNDRIISSKNRYIVVTSDLLTKIANQSEDESIETKQGWRGFNPGEKVRIGRKNENFGDTLGIGVSSGHADVEFADDGSISITDLISTNGTNLIKPNQLVGEKNQGEAGYTLEVKLGDVEFGLLGATEVGGRGLGYIFDTTTADGTKHRLVVYRSTSDGNWRSTLGIDEEGRFMKGSERARQNNHYTQETKLHPELRNLVENLDLDESIVRVEGSLIPKMTTMEEAMHAEKDFADRTRMTTFPDERLARALAGLRPGEFTASRLVEVLGLSPETTDAGLEERLVAQLEEVNAALEQSGVVPDFSRPNFITTEMHPLLGLIFKEDYTAVSGGRNYEWTMAYSKDGEKVWIDSIRFADAQISAFGTDEEVLDNALLTSKPVEYKSQTDGIPKGLRRDMGSDTYEDITPFLAKLEPIKKFIKVRDIRKAI